MTAKPLQDLLNEVETVLRVGALSAHDRVVLDQVRAELAAALASQSSQASDPPERTAVPSLRTQLQDALENLERDHPRLTGLVARTLDVLSDLGL